MGHKPVSEKDAENDGHGERSKRHSEKSARAPLRLTPRDLLVIWFVYIYRVLTSFQIQRLCFPVQSDGTLHGRLVHARQRLKGLTQHGYLRRDEQPTKLSEGRRPLVYFLDKKGAALLAESQGVEIGELDWHPRDNVAGASYPFLEHLLHTNDARIAFSLAADAAGIEVVRWLDDRELKRRHWKDYVEVEGERRKVAIVPDGYFHLRWEAVVASYEESGQTMDEVDEINGHFFLEADLATVVGRSPVSGRRTWQRKVNAYIRYFTGGGYQKRYQTSQLRILTVTTSATRLANLARITEEAGGRNLFWFTTFADLTAETVLTAPIWRIAGRSGHHALFDEEPNEK